MGFGNREQARSSVTPSLADPSLEPSPDFSDVLSEAELTEIRLRDIAFGDAEELGWD